MAIEKSKFEDVGELPYADITKDGIKYKVHHFNAKVTVKDPNTKQDIEVTVVRRAEREWLLSHDIKSYITATSAIIFCLDSDKLKSESEKIQKLIFG